MASSEYYCAGGQERTFDEEWYEQNLELAAELGKALLEKNRELESQVNQLQNIIHDQHVEIQSLKHQVEAMRTMTETRNRIYEEVDRTAQDLENTNKKMLMESRADKQKLENQSALIYQLEEKIDDLEKKLETLKTDETKLNGKVTEMRRTSSLNRLSLSDTKHQNSAYCFDNLAWTRLDEFRNIPLTPYELEIRKLQDSLHHLKTQQTIDRRKYEVLDVECSVLMEENQILENKVKALEAKLSEAIMVQYELEQTYINQYQQKISSLSVSNAREDMRTSDPRILHEIEHDCPELRSEGKAVKLDSGSSLYSSKESLNKVATDAKEIHERDETSLSILDELDVQYQALFAKYQALTQNKSKSKEGETRQQLAHKEVQTLLHITLSKDFGQDTNTIPPYKALFKDIFATLQKSRRE
ncbi:unnamed protein product [Candidula unifasciata]|uniref:Cerebellar degeneration-related protein 2-like n=1 Tax=Candidula unifasciata TaxID=100452 RepID=A0A8S3Z313_9EUPU|nr:unnamed protein product [Candidula unifasciata]